MHSMPSSGGVCSGTRKWHRGRRALFPFSRSNGLFIHINGKPAWGCPLVGSDFIFLKRVGPTGSQPQRDNSGQGLEGVRMAPTHPCSSSIGRRSHELQCGWGRGDWYSPVPLRPALDIICPVFCEQTPFFFIQPAVFFFLHQVILTLTYAPWSSSVRTTACSTSRRASSTHSLFRSHLARRWRTCLPCCSVL